MSIPARRYIGRTFLDRDNEIQELLKEWEQNPDKFLTLPKGMGYALEERSPLTIKGQLYEVKVSAVKDKSVAVHLSLWGES